MPKVGKEHYSFGHFTGVSFEYEIHFTKGKEVGSRGSGYTIKPHFFAKVPEAILKYKADPKEIKGDTYDDAKRNASAYFDEFYKKGIDQKKVIIYFLDWTCPRRFIEKPTYEGTLRADLPFNGFTMDRDHPKQELRLDYRVKWLVDIGGNKYLADDEISEPNELNGADNMSNPNARFNLWKMMDHTPEIEEWFKTTTEALGKMIAFVHAFFGDKPKHLLQSIEKKKLIFSSTPEVKDEK